MTEHAELYPYILLILLAAGVRLLERRSFRESVDFGLFFTVAWVG